MRALDRNWQVASVDYPKDNVLEVNTRCVNLRKELEQHVPLPQTVAGWAVVLRHEHHRQTLWFVSNDTWGHWVGDQRQDVSVPLESAAAKEWLHGPRPKV